MAYDIKWFSEFADIDGSNIYRVEVLDRDFAGSAVEVLSGGSPVNVERMGGDDPYNVIRSLKFTFEWIAQAGSGFEISDLFIIDDRKYRFRFYIYESGSPRLLFTGYLVFIDCEEPFNSKPYPVTFSGTCSLPLVRDDLFLTEFGAYVQGKISLIEVIANCLSSTGLELPIYSHINLFEQGMAVGSTSPLILAEIDSDGLRGKKGGYTIEGLLNAMGAFIVQSNGRWYLKDVRAQDAVNVNEWRFDYHGNATGYGSVNQSASFGRTAFDANTPNVFPIGGIGGVMQSIAEPNSIVTETVSPGISVNRLANGSFSGVVSGGQIPGWRKSIEGGTSWTRDGAGTPEDPYRLEYHNHVEFQPKYKQNKFRPLSYFEAGPIELNLQTFYISEMDIKDVKIIFSGALKMNNALTSTMNLNLNEQERDYADYMNESGDWLHSKKEDTEVTIRSSQAKHGPVKTYEDLEYQTFDITSKNLANQINIGGEGHIFIRLRVFPGVQAPGYFGNPVFISYEDLSIVIYTGLVFEGEHKYQVDSKLQIRNPNEVEFTIIIADKIGIDTPENKRPENRVMTGYMTLAGGNTLTAGWRRYVGGVVDPQDNVFEPIQTKILKERVRLYGGKRRVYSGSFMGKGLMPIHSVFNRFEEPGTPETFYTITDWKWDVKQMQYNTSFYELDFSKLAEEEVYLYDENASGSRGNRGYVGSGASGGSTSTPGAKPLNPILLDEVESIQYVAGKSDTEDRVVDLGVLIQSGHAPGLLEAKIISFPSWITSIGIDQGENTPDPDLPDEGILLVKWQGKPTVPGLYQIVVELSDAYGEDYLVVIPINVNSIPKVKFTGLDTDTPKTLGPIPGAYKLPGKVDVSALVTGYHNNLQMAIYGPSGELMNELMYADAGESELQTYRAFEGTDGFVPESGLYKIVFNVQSNMIIVLEGVLFFTLYTDAFLSKLKFELWNTAKIGDISIQDTSIFQPVEWFNPRTIVSDIEHDKATVTHFHDEIQVAQEVFTHVSPVMLGTYDVYNTPQTGQLTGKQRINAVLELGGVVVMERQNDFTVLAKDPVYDGYVVLGTMTPATANFTAIQDLPVSPVTIDLPDEGYNFQYTTVGGDYVRVEFLRKTGGAMTAMDVTKYTKQPDYVTFSGATIGEKVFAFGTLSSKEIGDLHVAPSSVRVRYTERLGGATGSILAIAEANVNFRIPLDPIDEAGLRFLNINKDTAEVVVIDPNMPKIGGVYALPVLPWVWSISFRKLKSGLEFDNVSMALAQDEVDLHNAPYGTDVVDYPVLSVYGYPGDVTTELHNDRQAFIFGTDAGDYRTLLNPSNVPVNFDVPSENVVTASPYRLGVLMDVISASFTLTEPEGETPEEDGSCCEIKRWDFVSEAVWNIPHNLDSYPEFNLIIAGQKWENRVDYPDKNNAQVIWKRTRTGFAETK